MEEVEGQSGRRYRLHSILQDKEMDFGRVYSATHEGTRYVVKEIPEDFTARTDIYQRIGDVPHLRTPKDTIPERRMLVFDYLDDNFLQLVGKNLPLKLLKYILKCALRGLSMLHEKDIVHNDVKPNNILVQTSNDEQGLGIGQVQLADLEDSYHVPLGKAIRGMQLGNWLWRSPEAHAEGPIEKPSDMFSFGIVCIYAVTQGVIFAVNEAELPEGVEPLAVVIEKQVSYFAEEDSMNEFLQYIGEDSPWHEIFLVTKNGFGKEQPREPFEFWYGPGVDDKNFKDLIRGLTHFNPDKRLTAKQALAHEWFADV